MEPDQSAEIGEALRQVNLDDFRARVNDADLESLVDEEELFELEPWLYDEPFDVEMLAAELRELTEFYTRAGSDGRGVVIFTT